MPTVYYILYIISTGETLQFIGRYKSGLPSGVSWLRLTGGAFHCGETDHERRLNTENGFYLYPDLQTGYNGTFQHGVMIRARAVDVEGSGVIDNIMTVRNFRSSKIWKSYFYF